MGRSSEWKSLAADGRLFRANEPQLWAHHVAAENSSSGLGEVGLYHDLAHRDSICGRCSGRVVDRLALGSEGRAPVACGRTAADRSSVTFAVPLRSDERAA